jgi:hypothetical protein
VVSYAFRGTWAGLLPTWSVLCIVWGVAVAVVALVPVRSELGELGLEVVEAQRTL